MSKKITVIGTGYVGLIAAIGLADFGNEVIGADINKEKIENLNKGISPIYEQGIEEYLTRNLQNGRLKFTNNLSEAIKSSEVIFIGVGTPQLENGEADLSQVKQVVELIADNLNNYKVIVTKSTVPIGTNACIKDSISKRTQNNDFDVVSNPEFLREGKAVYDFFHPDRVVIGYESEKAKEIMENIYRPLYLLESPFIWCNIETAELIKYASNAFLATKITFINQIANLSEKIGADIRKVSKAVGMDGRIGSKFLHPGPGYGGSCFPKDTNALVKIGEKYGVEMSLVREVVHSNSAQKEIMVNKLERLVGNLKGKTIAILGLAFKSETDDIRDSAAIFIINKLLEEGAILKVHDPKAIENTKKLFGNKLSYYEKTLEAIKSSDAVIILTEWNEYRNLNLELIKNEMIGQVLLDTRNIIDINRAKELGFIYEGVGVR